MSNSFTPLRYPILLASTLKPMKVLLPRTDTLRRSAISALASKHLQSTDSKGGRRFVSKMSTANEFPPEKVRAVVSEVVALLKERSETVSVAETAAGGIISASILSTPGASKIYKGGLTLYTLESRIAFAGWTQDSLKSYNGPTPDLVAGLASHVRGTLRSTYTISESGTAGPTASGNTPNRQPGYVALAVATEKGDYKRELFDLGSDREANMVTFAVEALKLLRDVIKGDAKL